MTREPLASAGEKLRAAADVVSDEEIAERLTEQADQMDMLAKADRGPDHGRLARHERILANIASDANGQTADSIEAAFDDIRAYRSTIEGV